MEHSETVCTPPFDIAHRTASMIHRELEPPRRFPNLANALDLALLITPRLELLGRWRPGAGDRGWWPPI